KRCSVNNKSIKDWKEDDRPREKLLNKGSSALSDAELLAIIIGSGTVNNSALQVAKEILSLTQNNIHELGRLTVQEVQKMKGIGQARAISIAAALELGRRRQQSVNTEKIKFTNSHLLFQWLQPQMQDLHHEVMIVLYLNRALQLVRQETISQGGMDAMHVDIR